MKQSGYLSLFLPRLGLFSLLFATPPLPAQESGESAVGPPSVPPEVWEQISRLNAGDPTVFVPHSLGPAERLLLVLIAAGVLLIGIIICRMIGNYYPTLLGPQGRFLFFGLFGSIAALIIACICTATLSLHLAAAACTVISGYSIAAFLTPQFALTRSWILPKTDDHAPPTP